jgi:hypothetical protein
MKIIKNIILFFIISILLIWNTQAYTLTSADRAKWDILVSKTEKKISKYWENTRKAQINWLKALKKSKWAKDKAIIDYAISKLENNDNDLESLLWDYVDYNNNDSYTQYDYNSNYNSNVTYVCYAKNINVNWHSYSVSQMNYWDIKEFVYQRNITNWYQNFKQFFSCSDAWIKIYWSEISYLPVCNNWYYQDWDYCKYDYNNSNSNYNNYNNNYNTYYSNNNCALTTQNVNWRIYTIYQMNNWDIREFTYNSNITNWYQVYKQSFKCNNWFLSTYWSESSFWTTCNSWYYQSGNYCYSNYNNNNNNNNYNGCASTTQYINWHNYNLSYLNHNEIREYTYQKNISNWYIVYKQSFKCYDWYISSYSSENSNNVVCYSWYYQSWDSCIANYVNNNNNCSSTTKYVNSHLYEISYMNNNDTREFTSNYNISNWKQTFRQSFRCDNWTVNTYLSETSNNITCDSWYTQSWNSCIVINNSCSNTTKSINWHIYDVWVMNNWDIKEFSSQNNYISNWKQNYRQSFRCSNWTVNTYWSETTLSPICDSWYYQNWNSCIIIKSTCGYTTKYVNWHLYEIWTLDNNATAEFSSLNNNISNWKQTFRQNFRCDNWTVNTYWSETSLAPVCNNWYYQSWNSCTAWNTYSNFDVNAFIQALYNQNNRNWWTLNDLYVDIAQAAKTERAKWNVVSDDQIISWLAWVWITASREAVRFYLDNFSY